MRKNRAILIKSKPTFAIVVDGNCEIWYLQMLKRNEKSITVNIEPKIPQRKKLLDQKDTAISLSKDYTKVFWIIDFDTLVSESRNTKNGDQTAIQLFLEYKKTIEKDYKNIVVIVNNPCIEFWLLLHFETTSKYFNTCKGAERQLKKYLKDYEKTQKYYTKQDNDIYLRLKPKLKDALSNGKKLKPFDIENTNKAISEMHIFFETDEFGQLFKKE